MNYCFRKNLHSSLRILCLLCSCFFLACCQISQPGMFHNPGKNSVPSESIDFETLPTYDQGVVSTNKILKTPVSNDIYKYENQIVIIKASPYDPSSTEIMNNNSINLDDLEQSNKINSDLEIIVTRGSQVFFILNPINGSLAYFSGNDIIDEDDCLQTLSKFSSESRPELLSGKPICIITNENRIAIVKVTENISHNIDDTYDVEVEFTLLSNPIK